MAGAALGTDSQVLLLSRSPEKRMVSFFFFLSFLKETRFANVSSYAMVCLNFFFFF